MSQVMRRHQGLHNQQRIHLAGCKLDGEVASAYLNHTATTTFTSQGRKEQHFKMWKLQNVDPSTIPGPSTIQKYALVNASHNCMQQYHWWYKWGCRSCPCSVCPPTCHLSHLHVLLCTRLGAAVLSLHPPQWKESHGRTLSASTPQNQQHQSGPAKLRRPYKRSDVPLTGWMS